MGGQDLFKIVEQTTCEMECLAKTPWDGLRFLQDAPKTAQRTVSGPPKTPPRRPSDGPRRPQDASKTVSRRLQDSLEDAPPSRPRFATFQTSILRPPDLDFRPSRPEGLLRTRAVQTSRSPEAPKYSLTAKNIIVYIWSFFRGARAYIFLMVKASHFFWETI